MSLAFKIFGSLLIVAVSFTVTLIVLDSRDPAGAASTLPRCPAGQVTALTGTYAKFGFGSSYLAPVPALDQFADSNDGPASKYLICENGSLLGPPHSLASDVSNIGMGRFSHWKGLGFIFASSDNSDPNTNGRRYQAVLPK